MTIHVTQEDIDKGTRGSFLACPIARAVKRQVGVRWAEVSDDHIRVADTALSGNVTRFRTPPEAADFINDFDSEEEVEPFSFELPAEVTP